MLPVLKLLSPSTFKTGTQALFHMNKWGKNWKGKNSWVEIKTIYEERHGRGGSDAKAIVHHLPQADQCPVSQPVRAALQKFLHGFIAKHDGLWHGTYLWSIWVSCHGCVAS